MSNFGLIRQGTSTAVLKSIPIPVLKDDYILVRTVAVALNPTDWTTLDAPGDDGTLVGCDYAGIVEEVGKAVTKPFKKGDRIAGLSPGGMDLSPESGTFAKYIAVKGDLQFHIPDHVSFEQAATIGSGILTAGYALYQVLGLPLPGHHIDRDDPKAGEPILIYGGSTATGTIAIQLANLAGRKVITTCSPKHFDLMKQRSAHEVYDYRTPNIGPQINLSTNNTLTLILDCIAIPSSAAICSAAFTTNPTTTSPADPKIYCSLLPEPSPHPSAQSIFFLGYDLLGEEYVFEGERYAAKPETYAFAKEWVGIAEALWEEGRWESHPERVREGGLKGVVEGLEEMRKGRGPSGEKWVYTVGETGWLEEEEEG